MLNKKLLLLSIFPCLAVVARGQDLVQNPGFETGDLTDWSFQAGDDSYFIVEDYWAHSGSYAVGFGAMGSTDDVIYQALATTPGQQYTVSLWYFNNQLPADLEVWWDTSDFAGAGNLFTSDSLPRNEWTLLSFTATATASSTNIGIGSRNFNDFNYVDDVDVSASPEPAQAALLSLGALALLRRRRRPSGSTAFVTTSAEVTGG